MGSVESAIVAHGLRRIFPPDLAAVDGIDLDIEAGQIFGFLGANGSGKTTTIRMLTTLLRPTEGSATVAGYDVVKDASKVRARVGVALQEASLDLVMTGRETLALQARLYRVPGGEISQRVRELLRIVDLEEAADRRVGTYSGGMQRRLDLAAALVHRPRIVFLDEPTSGLDPISRNTIWRYVEDLNRNDGVTFFLTTQYLEEADKLADEVAIMERGRIVAQGAPAALKASIGADVVTVRLEDQDFQADKAVAALKAINGLDDIRIVGDSVVVYTKDGSSAIAPIVLALDESSVAVEEVTLARPTLDDVFLRKTGHHMEADENLEPAGESGAAS
ncbi:MAG: ATP-binding cassette domain-containing protein [Chloroflexi bacterium]|nr:ATP-binding cassette domain-containing protein [Chloroflexota bacterium]